MENDHLTPLREGFERDAQIREEARKALAANRVQIEAGPGALIESTRGGKFIVSRRQDEI